jgi:GNAT superfamily N-acetyltransferase
LENPLATVFSSDPALRDVALRWVFAMWARYGLAFGEVWTVGELEGVAIWWAPEFVEPNDERARAVGLNKQPDVLPVDAWKRFLAFGAFSQNIHRQSITGLHWYLNAIGVAPESQGKGVGSVLLSSMFERLDRAQLPAYLDTGKEKNVDYYRHRGFILTVEAREPTTGILLRGMRRDPL